MKKIKVRTEIKRIKNEPLLLCDTIVPSRMFKSTCSAEFKIFEISLIGTFLFGEFDIIVSKSGGFGIPLPESDSDSESIFNNRFLLHNVRDFFFSFLLILLSSLEE